MTHDVLYNPVPPWVVLEPLLPEHAKLYQSARYRAACTNLRALIEVKVLRGTKMRTHDALMDEVSAALQFDQPFGENWPAVGDRLEDLYDWMPADAYILFVRDAQEVLCEDPQDLRRFLKRLNIAGASWSVPVDDNGPYNRPAVPFHTVMTYPPDQERLARDRYEPHREHFAWLADER